MLISLIVAASENGVIGRDNDMPWRLPTDLKRFKRLTMGSAIIMGRKTFHSIGRALPGRCNIVLTRDDDFKADGVLIARTIEAALALAQQETSTSDTSHKTPADQTSDKAGIEEGAAEAEVFVIGGAEIYKQTLKLADRVYLTRVKGHIEGDAYFPQLAADEWREVDHEGPFQTEQDSHEISFTTYMRD
ncbi:MAG: dihydrofolate reductase [Rhodomicrobium sp.]|nr:MAG: dihydrofolate reductase [Rhodomicrobium sp.]